MGVSIAEHTPLTTRGEAGEAAGGVEGAAYGGGVVADIRVALVGVRGGRAVH